MDILFYVCVFSLSLVLFWLGKYHSVFERVGLLIVIALSVFRFDIGNDYDNYYYIVDFSTTILKTGDFSSVLAASSLLGIEPFFELLCLLFKNTQYPFVYVMGVYGAFTILIWYKLLHKIDGVFWGFFLIMTYSILFKSFDQVRQVLAVSIFLCSFTYIEQRDWKRYLCIILLAACVHYSVLLVSFAYLILHRKPYVKIYLLVILIFYIGFQFNIWAQFRKSLFSLVGLYADFAESDRQLGAESFGSSLGLLFQVLMCSYLMVVSAKKYPILSNSLFIGCVLILFASGNLNINRLAYYFSFSTMLAFPLYIQQETKKMKIVILSLLLLIYSGRNLYGGSGCVPYDSVWGDNFKSLNFRIREYRIE